MQHNQVMQETRTTFKLLDGSKEQLATTVRLMFGQLVAIPEHFLKVKHLNVLPSTL